MEYEKSQREIIEQRKLFESNEAKKRRDWQAAEDKMKRLHELHTE